MHEAESLTRSKMCLPVFGQVVQLHDREARQPRIALNKKAHKELHHDPSFAHLL